MISTVHCQILLHPLSNADGKNKPENASGTVSEEFPAYDEKAEISKSTRHCSATTAPGLQNTLNMHHKHAMAENEKIWNLTKPPPHTLRWQT